MNYKTSQIRTIPAEFELRVTFQALTRGLCPYTIRPLSKLPPGVKLHRGHYQKPSEEGSDSNVQVDNPQAILRFKITAENRPDDNVYPVGIAFTRADETRPLGIAPTTGGICLPGSPFRSIKLNEPLGTIEIVDHLLQDVPTADRRWEHTHNTYQFVVMIQSEQTGEIGIIDPQIENAN